jgi:hypothetical protein
VRSPPAFHACGRVRGRLRRARRSTEPILSEATTRSVCPPCRRLVYASPVASGCSGPVAPAGTFPPNQNPSGVAVSGDVSFWAVGIYGTNGLIQGLLVGNWFGFVESVPTSTTVDLFGQIAPTGGVAITPDNLQIYMTAIPTPQIAFTNVVPSVYGLLFGYSSPEAPGGVGAPLAKSAGRPYYEITVGQNPRVIGPFIQ